MLVGETVYVIHTLQTGTDEMNAPTYEEQREQVDDVLVSPGEAQDVLDSNRPDGARVDFNLHFPKTYEGSLAHKKIEVRGIMCAVVGFPERFTLENTPTRWNMPVKVVKVDG